MRIMDHASLTVLLFSFFSFSPTTMAVKGGYWPADSPLSSLNASLYTHVFYAFAVLNPQTFEVTVSESNQQSIAEFTSTLQKSNPSVKTLISIGNSNRSIFAAMAGDSCSRKTFIDSSMALARQYSFHGLDLDWEYPNNATDMQNWQQLFSEWRKAVEQEAETSGNPRLLLTAAVYFSNQFFYSDVVREYPIASISDNMDWVNIMAYDLHLPIEKSDENKTGEHAALYDPNSKISTSYGVQSWLAAGLSPQKMVLGMPMYGHSWLLKSQNDVGIGAEATGPANLVDDALSFAQIKKFISEKGATEVYDETTVSAYCYAGLVWVGYDNEQSVATKVEYAQEKGLLGYSFWNMAQDSNWILSTIAFHKWGQ